MSSSGQLSCIHGALPKENEQRVEERLKVVVHVDRRVVVQSDLAEHLHADDGIDEEEHCNEQRNVWQRLECRTAT